MTDQEFDEYVTFLSQLMRIPAENPDGSTEDIAAFICRWLESSDAEVRSATPHEGATNVWASVGAADADRHLTLCTHLDTFPAGDPSRWSSPPYAAARVNGRIIGRGASAARAGLASLLWTFRRVARQAVPAGSRLTWIGAADTESGGRWGTGWLVEQAPEVVGTACLLGEPEGPAAVRIGERGKAQFRISTHGPGRPGALAFGEGPIISLSRAIMALGALTEIGSKPPTQIQQVIDDMGDYARNLSERGMNALLSRPSLNVGTIGGGVKVNLVPEEAAAEVDVRVPFGLTSEAIYTKARELLADEGCDDVSLEPLPPAIEPTWTSPQDPFVQLVSRSVHDSVGRPPTLSLGFASTDARYFRPRGVPSVIYGPAPINVGGHDEAVALDDLAVVWHVHDDIVQRYLNSEVTIA